MYDSDHDNGTASTEGQCLLTGEEVLLVQESWSQLQDVNGGTTKKLFGILILAKFFELEPTVIRMYPYFEGTCSELNLWQSRKMHCRVGQILKVLDYVTLNIRNGELIKKSLLNLGQRHTKLKLKLKPVQFQSLKLSIEYALVTAIGDDLTPAHLSAWNKVLNIITCTTMDGIDWEENYLRAALESDR